MGLRFIFLLLLPFCLQAQQSPNGMLLLQKNKKTIARYYVGSNISFYTTENMPVSGNISRLTKDSIYIDQYSIRRIPRADGGVIFDTSSIYQAMFHINNIGSFPPVATKGKNILTNGTLFIVGGAAYLFLNIFNTTRDGDPPFGEDNLPNVMAAAGSIAVGYGLKHAWPKQYKLGKKYSIKVLGSG